MTSTKKEAVDRARELVRNAGGGEVIDHGADGAVHTRQMRSARPVEAGDIVSVLTKNGVAQRDIATVTHVDEKTVYTWKTHRAAPRPAAYDRLDDLRNLVDELADTLTPRGITQWLRARNRQLSGRRPLEALADGDTAAVMGAARAFAEGTYV